MRLHTTDQRQTLFNCQRTTEISGGCKPSAGFNCWAATNPLVWHDLSLLKKFLLPIHPVSIPHTTAYEA